VWASAKEAGMVGVGVDMVVVSGGGERRRGLVSKALRSWLTRTHVSIIIFTRSHGGVIHCEEVQQVRITSTITLIILPQS